MPIPRYFHFSVRVVAMVVVAGCSHRRASPLPPDPEGTRAMAPELRDLLTHGSALSLAGAQDSALAVYRRALARWPDEYHVHAGLGTILDLMGRFDESRMYWRRAISLASPQQAPSVQQQLAISYAFECRAEDAAQAERVAIDARQSARDFAGAAAVYNEQARIYLECGHPDRALAWYRDGYATAMRAVALSDTARSLWEFRWEHAQARVAARQGRLDDARRHAAAAGAVLDRGLNPDQSPFLPYLSGYVAYFAGDYATAITELSRANQSDPFVLALLARAYQRRGDVTSADEYRRRALAIHAHGLTVAFARSITAGW